MSALMAQLAVVVLVALVPGDGGRGQLSPSTILSVSERIICS